jgi:hypothetical protein
MTLKVMGIWFRLALSALEGYWVFLQELLQEDYLEVLQKCLLDLN